MRNIPKSKRIPISFSSMLCALFLLTSCRGSLDDSRSSDFPGLVGAWKAKLQFQSGAFAPIENLEFMYAFNEGGTMTESSNYDAAPPVPPAYGVWKKLGNNEYEAKYEFFITRNPTAAESTESSGGWLPAGHGVFHEKITLSEDGNSFASLIRYEVFDPLGQSMSAGGDAKGQGERLRF